MTRRGSLVYYLAAWILGCFFMSTSIWIKDLWGPPLMQMGSRQAFGMLLFYVYSLSFGASTALLGAFLLRRLMALLKCKTPAHWAGVGAILAPVLIGILGTWGRHASSGTGSRPAPRLLAFVTFGPMTVLEAGWWLAVPAGAATAYLLCRIHRAFLPEPQEPPSNA